MAPKRKRRDGYSDEGLRALERGTYGKETGRTAQFTSSQGQLQQSKTLPYLTGIKKVDTSAPTEERPKAGTKRFDSGLNKSQEIPTLNKPSTRYQNQTAAEAAPTVSRDTTFDKDFDEFHKYRVGEYLDRRDYDPVTDQDVEHWRNLKQEIMAKNNWSDAEFDKRWEEYYTDRAQKEADQYVNNTVEFTKKHPIAGSLLSLADTAGTWIEGGATALEGLASLIAPEEFKQKYMRDKSTDPGFTYTRQRAAVREAVKDKITNPVAKFAYETAMGLPEMAAGPLAMATQTAGNMQMNALERGVNRDKAAQTGTVGGVASYVANKVGFEKMLGAEASNIYSQIAKAGAEEGLENVAEDIMNMVSDQIINQENSEVSSTFKYYKAQGMTDREAIRNTFTDYLKQAATSFGSGAIFGSLFNATNSVPELYGDIKNRLTDRKINSNEIVKGIKNGDIQSLVDNGPMTSYNNVAEGEINGRQAEINGRGDQGNPRPEELNAVGEAPSGSVDGQRTYTREDGRTFSLRDVVDENLSRQMDDAGINNFGLKNTTGDTQGFSKQLAEAKASNKNGRMVDGKSPEDLTDAILFSDDAKTCGVAIEPNGNIVAVHKNSSNKQRGAVDDMLITARANGGDRLDCYGIGLVNKYEQDGFVPVARIEWNDEFKPDDWGDNDPEEIFVMMKDNRTNEQVIDDIKNGRSRLSSLEELDALPYYSLEEFGDDAYDAALNYRDALISGQPVQPARTYAEYQASKQQPVVDPAARRNQLAELTQTIEQKRAELNQIPQVNKAERQARYDELQALQQQAKDIVSGKAVPELAAQSAPVKSEPVYSEAKLKRDSHGDYVYDKYRVQKGEVGYNIYDESSPYRTELITSTETLKEARETVKDLANQDRYIIPVDENGVPKGTQEDYEGEELREYLDIQNKRVSDFLSKRSGELDLEGHIFEKYTKKYMLDTVLKDYKENGFVPEDSSVYIAYKDGSDAYYGPSDDFGDVNLKNVDTVIWENENTSAFCGDNVDIFSTREYDSPHGQEWVLDVHDPNRPKVDVDEEVALNNTGLENEAAQGTENAHQNYDPNDFIITETVEPAGEGSKREGYSQVATNSLVNAGIIDASEIDNNPVVHEMAKSATKSNDVSFNAAFDNVKQNGATILDNIINDRAEINSDQTVDEAFILLQDLNDKIDQGDQNALNQKYLLMERLIKAGQRYGRMIQAFAKWNDTPEGLIVNSKSILQEQTDAEMSRNQDQHEKNKKIAEEIVNITNGPGYSKPKQDVIGTNSTLDTALRTMGYDKTMDQTKVPKTHDELRAEVENSISKELGSIGKQIDETGYNFLTNLVENKVPVDVIRDEIEHFLKYGEWYTIDESTPVKKQISSKLAGALSDVGNDSIKASAVPEMKRPKSHATFVEEVKNTLDEDMLSVGLGTDTDIEVLANFLEEGVPRWKIADEIQHRLEFGEWYTLDESTPTKKPTSKQLSRILSNMGNDSLKAKNRVPETGYPAKSHDTIKTEVVNTLEKDAASLGLDKPGDAEFITIMLEEGVPAWQIEDEITHRLMTGEWYTLDESIEEAKPVDNKIMNALNSLVAEEAPAEEAPELTFDEMRERVKNALEGEPAMAGISRLYTNQGDITDADIDYLTNLRMNGATTEEIANALDTKYSTGTFDISQDAQNKINMLFEYARHYDPNSKEACQAKAAAYQIAANEVVGKASAFEKFEAWRYLAMLGNPKTMLRNWIGNNLFGAYTGVSNTLAAIGEAAADKLSKNGIDRTKAVLNPFGKADKALISRSKADGDEHRYVQLDSQKYEKMSVKERIKAEKSVFNSKLMQLYENATDAGISDYKAVKRKYGTSLAGWLKANGYDESIFDADEAYRVLKDESRRRVLSDAERAELDNLKQYHDTLEKARDYAVQQAEYATFHEDNAFAQALSRSSNFLINNDKKSLRALGYMLEGVVPFKKTPANILKSGMEMSPLGIFSSVGKSLKYAYENTGSRKGNLADEYTKTSFWRKNESTVKKTTASELIDSWAKTLTGSGLAALGYYLSSKGILNLSNKDEKYQDQLEGTQNYSITINGKNFTIDWAAPAAMPLLLGAAVHNVFERNAISNKKFYENADELIGTINAVLDPLFETSMMSGVKDTLNTAANEIKYNDDSAVGGILGALATNALTGYVTQAVPTALGQVARVIDPTRRATDTATEGFIGGVEKQGRKMMNKLPGLSFLNPAYIDARGQEQNNSPSRNPLLSIPYQMLSPSYITDVNQTPADKMAREVFYGEDADGKPILDSDVFQSWSSTVRANGEKLNPKQMEEYRRKSGSVNQAIRTALTGQQWFDEMDATKQANLLKNINTLVKKIGLEDYTDASGKDYEAYKKGGVPALMDYYKGQQIGKQIEEKTGLSASSNAYKEIKNDLLAGNQKAADEKLKEYSVEKPMMEKAEEIDVSPQRYKQIVEISGDNAEKVEADLPKLKELGASNDDLTTYARAVTYNENLTPEKWKSKYDEMNTDTSNILKQDEIIDYANKKKLSLPQLQDLWNLYASGTDGEAPKSQPYIKKDGTFGRHTKK